MNPPATATSLNKPFTGWDELRPGGGSSAWRIEKPESAASSFVPFFPDQNGKVYEQLLHNLPVMLHCMDGTGRIDLGQQAVERDLRLFARPMSTASSSPSYLTPDSRSHLVKNDLSQVSADRPCRATSSSP